MDKSRILVVEDEPLVGMEIQDSLVRLGYDVPPVVNSGDAVLESALRLRPDLILMDVRLKGFLDGIDAAQRLRMISDVPIIYLTAYSTPEVLSRAVKTEPAAYILKPFDEKELHANITLALSRNRKSAASETHRVGGTIINALHTPALLVDEDLTVRAVNPPAFSLLGFQTETNPEGKSIKEYMMSTEWKDQEPRGFFPMRWKAETGSNLDLHMRVERFPHLQGSDSTMLLLFEALDPRERKLMENVGKDLNAEVRSLLPANGRILSQVQIAGELIPCSSGSGDLYDVFRLDDRTIVFYLLDVMGHGSMPALFACVLHEVIRSRAAQEFGRAVREERPFSPGRVLVDLNRKYQRREGQSRFFTMVLGVFDPTNGSVRLVRAGHPPCLLVAKDGVSRLQPDTGVALGIFEDAKFAEIDTTLEYNDKLVLISDGLLDGIQREKTDSHDQALERSLVSLSALIAESKHLDVSDMVSVVMSKWTPDDTPEGQQDDASILIIQRKPAV